MQNMSSLSEEEATFKRRLNFWHYAAINAVIVLGLASNVASSLVLASVSRQPERYGRRRKNPFNALLLVLALADSAFLVFTAAYELPASGPVDWEQESMRP